MGQYICSSPLLSFISLSFILCLILIMALPAAGLSAHTAQALAAWPVSASIPNAIVVQSNLTRQKTQTLLQVTPALQCFVF
ncbi:MAG: hypothetical protein JWP67_3169 [Mucilaginibacter sp.]|jgi:hypothetical protein|nr:hypothetical protein [Mucilaginibacter sp.]